jgi:acyl-coenzyme A thioesterase PaaI-like protein
MLQGIERIPPTLLRQLLNLWPPFLGAGIRVSYLAPNWRAATVEMKLRWYNRNPHKAHFGGSLYAMTDPFFALLVRRNLPSGYIVWDRSASIDYLAPGRGRVWARFEILDEDLERILRMTGDGGKHLHLFRVDVCDDDGLTIARVEKLVYIRKVRES